MGYNLRSVNESTAVLAPQHSMAQLGSVLPRIIEAIARAPLDRGHILFSKIDIKDGYWRMMVEKGQEKIFVYVLPGQPGKPTRIVVRYALQMGWTESPAFFCAATETTRDIAEANVAKPIGCLPPHPLEEYMVPPSKWLRERIHAISERYLKLVEVYVDDFCSLAQTQDVQTLLHISRSLLHAIHGVFLHHRVGYTNWTNPSPSKT